MPVNLYPVKMTIADEVKEVVLKELEDNGIRQGSLYIGPNETTGADCCVMLVALGRTPYSAVTSPRNLVSPDSAEKFAKEFAHQWNMAQ